MTPMQFPPFRVVAVAVELYVPFSLSAETVVVGAHGVLVKVRMLVLPLASFFTQ